MSAIQSQQVFFTSLDPNGVRLAGEWTPANGASQTSAAVSGPAVVLCHPQPLVNDMNDPLTQALQRELVKAGWSVLRFNFRGAPPSGGAYTDGRLELFDIAAAVLWLRSQPQVDSSKVAIAGHAFGAAVALVYAAADPSVAAVAAVSPPIFRLQQSLARQIAIPCLLLSGENDEVCPPYKLEQWIQQNPSQKTQTTVPRAEHLMKGYEVRVAALIASYFHHTIPQIAR